MLFGSRLLLGMGEGGGFPAATKAVAEWFPMRERATAMGIAEANMTSFAAGLSLTGKIPFTNSFAVFAAGRAYDQIRQGICIPGLKAVASDRESRRSTHWL